MKTGTKCLNFEFVAHPSCAKKLKIMKFISEQRTDTVGSHKIVDYSVTGKFRWQST